MRKNIRTTKQIIKALSIGISATMLLQPVAAMADELDNQDNNSNNSVEDNTNAEVQDTDDAVKENIEVADKALDLAIEKEEAVANVEKPADITIGADVLSKEALAALAEKDAKADVEAGSNALVSGNEAVAENKATMEAHVNNVLALDKLANDKYEETVSAGEATKDALDAANAATNSNEASIQAGVAIEEATKAENAAVSANDALATAKEEYEKAEEAYNAALKAAEDAVKEANKAFANGAKDAQEALNKAKEALDLATALKSEKDKKYSEANSAYESAKVDYDKADYDANIATLNSQIATLNASITSGIVELAEAQTALTNATTALTNATNAQASAATTLSEKEKAISDLKDAKEEADKAYNKALDEYNSTVSANGAAASDMSAKKDALDALKTALDSIEAAIEVAEEDLESAKESETAAKNEFDAIKNRVENDGYEKTIFDIEKEIVEAKTDDEKAAAVTKLENAVVVNKYENATYEDGYYVVEKEDGKHYYKSNGVNADGSIDIFEYDLNIAYKKTVDKVSGNVENPGSNATVTLVSPAEEAKYEVKYNEVKYEANSNTTMTSAEFLAMYPTSVDDGLVVRIENVLVVGEGFVTLYYKHGAYGWRAYFDKACTKTDIRLGYLSEEDRDVVLHADKAIYGEEKTVSNVTASDLSQYSSLANYSATEKVAAKDAVYEVTYKNDPEEMTQSDLDALLTKLGSDLVTYVKITDAVAAGTVLEAAEEAEYRVTYTETDTKTVDRNHINNEECAKLFKDGYSVRIAKNGIYNNGQPFNNVVGIYTKDAGPEANLHGRAYFAYLSPSGKIMYQDFANDNVEIVATKITTTTVEDVPESELNNYNNLPGYSTELTKERKDAVVSPGKEATYSVTTYKYEEDSRNYVLCADNSDASQSSLLNLYNSKNQAYTDATEAKNNASDKVDALTHGGSYKNEEGVDVSVSYNDSYDKVKADYDAALEEYNKAVSANDLAKNAFEEEAKKFAGIQETYNGYYGGANYTEDLKAAEKAVEDAKDALIEANGALETATTNKTNAQSKLDDVSGNLSTARSELTEKQSALDTVTAKKQAADEALADLSGKSLAAKAAADYASALETDAKAAYDAAVVAKQKVDNLLNSATASKEELELARVEFVAAKAAYEDAQKKASDARDIADQAKADYEEAAKRVQALEEAEEAARRDEEARREAARREEARREAERLAAEEAERLANLQAAANGGQRVVNVNAATATEEAEEAVIEIPDEEAPLAAGIEEAETEVKVGDEAEIEIADAETPLAPGTVEEEGKMNWWWLLIVLVLGTTGAEMYRRHQLKKKAKAEERNN